MKINLSLKREKKKTQKPLRKLKHYSAKSKEVELGYIFSFCLIPLNLVKYKNTVVAT